MNSRLDPTEGRLAPDLERRFLLQPDEDAENSTSQAATDTSPELKPAPVAGFSAANPWNTSSDPPQPQPESAATGLLDYVTIARAIKPRVPLAKVVRVDNGTIRGVEPAPKAYLFEFEEIQIRDLASLGEAVMAAARDPYAIAVRGRPKARQGRRAIYDDPEKGPAGLETTQRRWIAFDWDGLPLTGQSAPEPPEVVDDPAEFCNWSLPDPLLDPEVGVWLAFRRLPPPFRAVSCFWQISASAGFMPGFRLRTWHWLDRPLTGDQVKTWLAPAIRRGLVDPVTLVEAQPHYLGVRLVGGPDPAPRRLGFLWLEVHTVLTPNVDAMRDRHTRKERTARNTRYRLSGARPSLRGGCSQCGDRAQEDARRRIDGCLEAIRRALARHTTYKAEAARAFALCERYGLEWRPVRAALKAAYLSTLTPAEARERARYSVEGVLRWLERRAA